VRDGWIFDFGDVGVNAVLCGVENFGFRGQSHTQDCAHCVRSTVPLSVICRHCGGISLKKGVGVIRRRIAPPP